MLVVAICLLLHWTQFYLEEENNKMKKILAIMIVLVMVLGLSLTAFAASPWTGDVLTFDNIDSIPGIADRGWYVLNNNETGYSTTTSLTANGNPGNAISVTTYADREDQSDCIVFWINVGRIADHLNLPDDGADMVLRFHYFDPEGTVNEDGEFETALGATGNWGDNEFTASAMSGFGYVNQWVEVNMLIPAGTDGWLLFDSWTGVARTVRIDNITIVEQGDLDFSAETEEGYTFLIVRALEEGEGTPPPAEPGTEGTAPAATQPPADGDGGGNASTFDVGIIGFVVMAGASATGLVVLKKKK